MLNRSASLAMSTSVLKGLPGKLDIKTTHLDVSMYQVTYEIINVYKLDINYATCKQARI